LKGDENLSIKSFEECLAIVTEGVPEFLKANEDYYELLKVLAYALQKNYDELNRIDNAYNIDFVDIRELSKIANTLGIEYPIEASEEVLRLILKYYGKIIKNRGTLDSIKQMVRLLEMGESELYDETLFDYTNVEVILVEPGTLQVKYNGNANSDYAYKMLRKVVPAGYRFEITNMIDERIKRSDSLTSIETLDSIVETLGNKIITLIIDGSVEASLCRLDIVSSSDIIVEWGDGSPNTVSPTGNFSHNYGISATPYTVVIQSSGDILGFNVDYINNTSRITTATIEIDTLSSLSFRKCGYLVDVTLPTSLPLMTSANYMFEECTTLVSIDVSAFINVTSTEYMFFSCTSLPAIDISSMTSIINASHMFYNCTLLSSVDVSNLINIQDATGMFQTCSSLVYIDVSDLIGVINGSYMFSTCPILTSVDIAPMTLLEDSSYMFAGCSSLTSMDLTGLELLTTTSHMFLNCYLLTSVTFVYHPQLEDVGYMFYGCNSLPSVDVSSLTNVFNAYSMFYNCFNLTSIDISVMTKVYLAARMFYNCTSLSTIIAHNFCKDSIEGGANDIIDFVFSCSSLTSLDLTDARFRTVERLDAVYTSLYDRTLLSEGTIIVTGVAVEGTSNKTIATDKNWNVVASSGGIVNVGVSDSGVVGDTSSASISSDGGIGGLTEGMIGLVALDNTGTYTLTVTSSGTITVDWGDGIVNNSLTHTYGTTNGTLYTIRISSTLSITQFKVTTSGAVGYGVVTAVIKSSDLTTASYMFQHCSLLSLAILPDSLLSVQDASGLFRYCSSLTSVDISKLVNVKDTTFMFQNCTSLTSIDVSHLTSLLTAYYMFNGCTSLASIDISALTTLLDATGMFYGCTSLTSIDLTEQVLLTTANSMLRGCTSLTSVNTSGLIKVTASESMFRGCTSLTIIDVSTMIKVGSAFDMFNGCTSLDSVNVSNLTQLMNASQMFYGCTSLVTIDISDFTKVTSASGMFYGCTNLTSCDVSTLTKLTNAVQMFRQCSSLASVNVSNLTLLTDAFIMFGYCTDLTSIDISDLTSVTTAPNMFVGCTSLTSLDITALVKVISISHMFTNCTSLVSVNATGIGSGSTGIISTASFVSGCSALTSLDLTNSLYDTTATRLNDIYTSLYNRSSLSAGITIVTGIVGQELSDKTIANNKNWNVNAGEGNITLTAIDNTGTYTLTVATAGILTIDWGDGIVNSSTTHTYGTTNGTIYTIRISSSQDITEFVVTTTAMSGYGIVTATLSTTELTTAENMFQYCSLLTSVTLPDSLLSVTNASFMFAYCVSLTSIDVSALSEVTNAENMFRGCTLLDTVNTTALTSVTNANSMFFECISLASINISLMTQITDASFMFSDCTSLTSINTNDLGLLVLAEGMFTSCSALTSAVLSSCYSLENIYGMFFGCSSLESINLFGAGSGSTGISSAVGFTSGCDSLYSIDLSDSKYTVPATLLDTIYTYLPDRTGLDEGNISVVGVVGHETADITIATNKNWNVAEYIPFVSTWDTRNNITGNDYSVDLPFATGTTPNYVYNCKVFWGDGSSSIITAYNDADKYHEYAVPGIYTISIYGPMGCLQFGSSGFHNERKKIIDISLWGDEYHMSGNAPGLCEYFWGCENLNITATDSVPLYVGIDAFRGCTSLNAPLTFEGTYYATRMFYGCTNFNSPVTFINSHIYNADSMFRFCYSFDQDVSLFGYDFTYGADFTRMFESTDMSRQNYDKLLIEFDRLNTITPVVGSLAALGSAFEYSPGAPATARANLVAGGWNIQDGGEFAYPGQYQLSYLWGIAPQDPTGGSLPTSPVIYDEGDTVTVSGSGTLYKTGYRFDSWNTQTNGMGTRYVENDTFLMPNRDITLHTIWVIDQFTFTYDPNNADGGEVSAPPTEYDYLTPITILDEGTLYKTGYYFAYWNVLPSGDGYTYSPGLVIVMPANDLTLYATFSINYYTVTYDGNGNTGGTVPTEVNKTHGSNFYTQLHGTLVKSGYTFSHWNTQADGNGTSHNENTIYFNITGNITFYAIWI
jgi:hypothetical protein